ncbi:MULTISPECIES: hypothetical protein [Nonlabens]|uniref:hypothetical protein n=1 Tax=Nonlabens TaxID=363408 RepID=UPI001428A77B|nr:hypothetical protein [Nonlabens sp. SY33080]
MKRISLALIAVATLMTACKEEKKPEKMQEMETTIEKKAASMECNYTIDPAITVDFYYEDENVILASKENAPIVKADFTWEPSGTNDETVTLVSGTFHTIANDIGYVTDAQIINEDDKYKMVIVFEQGAPDNKTIEFNQSFSGDFIMDTSLDIDYCEDTEEVSKPILIGNMMKRKIK